MGKWNDLSKNKKIGLIILIILAVVVIGYAASQMSLMGKANQLNEIKLPEDFSKNKVVEQYRGDKMHLFSYSSSNQLSDKYGKVKLTVEFDEGNNNSSSQMNNGNITIHDTQFGYTETVDINGAKYTVSISCDNYNSMDSAFRNYALDNLKKFNDLNGASNG